MFVDLFFIYFFWFDLLCGKSVTKKLKNVDEKYLVTPIWDSNRTQYMGGGVDKTKRKEWVG